MSKISSAVTSALEEAQSSGSDSDPNQTIQNAIAQLLSGNSGNTQASNGTTSAASQSASSSGNATGETNGTSPQSFLQTLQSYGVDPQQFRQDFLAALQSANGGQTGTNSMWQALPAGSLVDTQA
jgi:hypothetical protein